MTYKEIALKLCEAILDNPCGCDGCPLNSGEVDSDGNAVCEMSKDEVEEL